MKEELEYLVYHLTAFTMMLGLLLGTSMTLIARADGLADYLLAAIGLIFTVPCYLQEKRYARRLDEWIEEVEELTLENV